MTNGRTSRIWIGLCLALLSACKFESSATPSTQLVVDVDAESAIRTRMQALKLLVAGAQHRDYLDERTTVLDETLQQGGDAEGFNWPVRLVMVPKQGDSRRVFELSATALDSDGALVAQGRVITGYVPHEVRYARLVLEADCYKTRCGELETCRTGGCTDAFVEPGDLGYPPAPDAGVIDAGDGGTRDTGMPMPDSGMDSGMDAGMDSSMPPDSGPPPIDPCLKNNGGCDPLVECLSVDGVPACGQCPNGFIDVNGDGARCEDIDECEKDKGGCDKDHGVCTNTPGGRDCACEPGYNGNGRECAVNVPCSENPAVCDTLATCEDIAGRKVCQCKTGYEGNGGSCTDIDECTRNLDNCVTHSTCANTEGSFTCTCVDGYTMLGGACVDVDECQLNTDNCDSMPDACRNVDGTFTCQCPGGYTGSGVGDSCQDVNECTSNADNCDNTPDACNNTVGSFVCACPAGYLGTGIGNNGCIDIDECLLNVDTCDNTPDACVNDVGGNPGYHCTCPAGYSGNGSGQNGCVDIDQCAMNTDDCDTAPDACVNDIGGLPGFHCTCPAGYMGSGVGGNGCVDIDQCMLNTDTCDDNPDACVNDAGGLPGYHCTCPMGWTGNGQGANGCDDVNQCAMNMDNCDDMPDACMNTTGSPGFMCQCPAGYTGNGVGAGGCTEVDECAMAATNDCDTSPVACVNDIGGSPGYHCACPTGYTGTGVGPTGCMDKDECAPGGGNDCNANADCTNTPAGSFTCTCRAGYTGTGHGTDGCTDANACMPTNPCLNGGDCTDNAPGAPTAYTCACKCGYTGAECQTAPATSTLGPTSFATSATEMFPADTIIAVPVNIGATARTLVGFGVAGATGTATVHLGLYTDSGAAPATRLYESGDIPLSSAIVSANPCIQLAANSTVWIAIQGSAMFGVASEMGGTNINRYRMSQAFAQKLPASFTPMADSGPNLALYLVTSP